MLHRFLFRSALIPDSKHRLSELDVDAAVLLRESSRERLDDVEGGP